MGYKGHRADIAMQFKCVQDAFKLMFTQEPMESCTQILRIKPSSPETSQSWNPENIVF